MKPKVTRRRSPAPEKSAAARVHEGLAFEVRRMRAAVAKAEKLRDQLAASIDAIESNDLVGSELYFHIDLIERLYLTGFGIENDDATTRGLVLLAFDVHAGWAIEDPGYSDGAAAADAIGAISEFSPDLAHRIETERPREALAAMEAWIACGRAGGRGRGHAKWPAMVEFLGLIGLSAEQKTCEKDLLAMKRRVEAEKKTPPAE